MYDIIAQLLEKIAAKGTGIFKRIEGGTPESLQMRKGLESAGVKMAPLPGRRHKATSFVKGLMGKSTKFFRVPKKSGPSAKSVHKALSPSSMGNIPSL